MVRFLVAVIGGLALGGVYTLIALGLVLAWRATQTLNFAHGQLILLAAMLAGDWQSTGGSIAGSALVAAAATALICVVFYRLVLRRTTGLPPFLPFVATLGLAAMIESALAIAFGGRRFPIELGFIPQGTTSIGGARFSSETLTIAALTVGLGVAVAATMRWTRIGIQVRAAGQDPVLASQGGINVHLVHACSWIAAGVLAAIAGLAYGSTIVVDPSLATIALAAFPAILLGGLDSFEGAVVGGLIIGLVQGLTATYLGSSYTQVVTYALLLVVLLVLPDGLFGSKVVTRL